MTSYFNLLKYAQTGIASPDMTYYDRMRASTIMGGVVQTLTGIPPLTFKADGSPLISWSMKGNGSQTGTPTPDNPVMPEFVGVRTANLWSEDYTGISGTIKYVPIYVGNGDVTLSTTCGRSGTGTGAAAVLFLLAGSVSTGASTTDNGVWNGNDRTVSAIDGYVTVAFRAYATANPDNADTMLNSGSTALPYEPFGYKIPISCGGETTPVYLGQVSTVRRIRKLVLDGTETWYASSTSQGNSRFVKGGALDANTGERSNILCTHLVYNPNYNYVCVYIIESLNLSITMPGEMTAADFKSYLAAQYAAGTPVCVWYVLANEQTGIVNEPLAKIGTYADELHSTDAAVTIPTVKGSNVLTVDTTIQPSEMTITFKG